MFAQHCTHTYTHMPEETGLKNTFTAAVQKPRILPNPHNKTKTANCVKGE